MRFPRVGTDTDIAAVRGWFRQWRSDEFRWLVGPSATPAGLSRLLLETGAARDEAEPELTAMVLDREPPTSPGIRVRPVATLADFEHMETIKEEVFGRSPEQMDRRTQWTEFKAAAGTSAFLAELDSQPVAFGVMCRTDAGPVLLAGGVTLPQARGHGAYRALVHARWEAAHETGQAVLVTQAQEASRPILERLGFQATGTIEVLVDHPSKPSGDRREVGGPSAAG
jgi:hypothetical protein